MPLSDHSATSPPTPAQVRLMEAGQRNHAAVRYHFGSLEKLVRAIYAWRAAPLDAARRRSLQRMA